jgi:hypothetical protein
VELQIVDAQDFELIEQHLIMLLNGFVFRMKKKDLRRFLGGSLTILL